MNWLLFNQPAWISNLSNLTSITVLGGIVAVWRSHNCADKKCFRIGRHPVNGTTFRTCRRHTTAVKHDELTVRHAVEQPEQHNFLNQRSTSAKGTK